MDVDSYRPTGKHAAGKRIPYTSISLYLNKYNSTAYFILTISIRCGNDYMHY